MAAAGRGLALHDQRRRLRPGVVEYLGVYDLARQFHHCNQEAYAQLLEDMVKEKQEVLADLAQKARAFRYILISWGGSFLSSF